ncbi:enoyl-CoA hydratase/isomerase family protein [Halostagnicola bangensis]
MQPDFETTEVTFETDTGIGHVLLDRPDSLNALSDQLREDLIGGLEYLESFNDGADEIVLRAVVLEGAGENFCAGADINEFSESTPGRSSERTHYDVITDFPVPVIAKIQGYCLGGGLETALACDVRIAHEESRFAFPEVDLGIIPGAGGVQYTSRLANPAAAMELAMTGEHVSASKAADLGIVNRTYGDDFEDETRAFAETIASKPPLAVQAIKESATLATQTGLQEGRRYDRQRFDSLLETEDHEKGARAFADDEYEPEFTGR